MKRRWLAIATISTTGLLLLSGFCANGSLDPYVPSNLNQPCLAVFAASGLLLLLLGVIYLVGATGRWRQGRTWAPLLVFGSAFLAASTLLAVVEFNVHLYGPWLLLFLATVFFSGVAIVFLIAARAWALYSGSAGWQNDKSRTA